jgi:hypothetical protein
MTETSWGQSVTEGDFRVGRVFSRSFCDFVAELSAIHRIGGNREPRLAWQDRAGRTGGGALRPGPRPSHRHLPATRRPDGKFYFGYRPGRGRVLPPAGQQAKAAAQPSKPQPAQTVPQPGSMEWLEAQKNKG